MALTMMGPIPVDSLVKLLTGADPKVAQRAEDTLIAIGAPAVPALVKPFGPDDQISRPTHRNVS